MKTQVPHKNLYINVHSSIIHNGQQVGTTQMSIKWWMDKQNTVCPYSGILSVNLKNEVLTHARNWWILKTSHWVKETSHERSHTGLPWWSSGQDSACQSRGHGSFPGPGRPHMPRGNKPICHNSWACASEPGSRNYWARVPACPRSRALQREAHALRNQRRDRAATKIQHSHI